MSSADLLLHPVRLRIIQAFLGNRALTTAELSAELSDIPSATLYRHVGRLVDAGVLTISRERRVRGAVERTYELRSTLIGPDELATMSVEDHRHAFMAFVAALLENFDRYLDRGRPDLVRDGVQYRLNAFWVDDREFAEMMGRVNEVLLEYAGNPPAAGRKRRILASAWLKGDDA